MRGFAVPTNLIATASTVKLLLGLRVGLRRSCLVQAHTHYSHCSEAFRCSTYVALLLKPRSCDHDAVWSSVTHCISMHLSGCKARPKGFRLEM